MANQNVTQLTQQTVSANPTSLFYAVTGGSLDTGLPLSVFVNSLGLTGTPTAPTATTGTNTTQIASTAFVQAQMTSTLANYALKSGTTFTGGVVIPSGTINNTTIGASNPSTGVFSTLASGSVNLTGGSINATSIGASTPSTGSFSTISATGLITPTSSIGIKGTATNDNASGGAIGEVVSATLAAGSGVALTTGTAVNVTSISLTAGDWDVRGQVAIQAAGGTVTIQVAGAITATSATLPLADNVASATNIMSGTLGTGQLYTLPLQPARLSLSGTTTVYLVAQSGFSASTSKAYGYILARRAR